MCHCWVLRPRRREDDAPQGANVHWVPAILKGMPAGSRTPTPAKWGEVHAQHSKAPAQTHRECLDRLVVWQPQHHRIRRVGAAGHHHVPGWVDVDGVDAAEPPAW